MINTKPTKDKIISIITAKISACTPRILVSVATIFSLLLSVSFLYLVLLMIGEEFTALILLLSMIVPALVAPPLVYALISLTKHLKYFQDNLEIEIEKNKAKDIILFEQARFALMGEMLANISHQWKQPLNTIGLATVDARLSNYGRNNLEKDFDIIEDNIRYLATTIDDFMSFFDKKTNLELRTIPSIVKEVKSIVNSYIVNKNIELEINIAKSTEDIKVASSISQVILNILNNAKDAFDADMKDKKITLIFEAKDCVLEIICVDNGKGIPLEIEEKIFDPYFTTKEKQQGTGIGLYMSKQIVQKLFNGTIVINSKKNPKQECENKTCFYIEIPYSDRCTIKACEI